MKHKLVENFDIITSDLSDELNTTENAIAAYIENNGISTYYAHNIAFYPDSGEIVVGIYDCGCKNETLYIKDADALWIYTKPKLKTNIVSKNTHTRLEPALKTLIETWVSLIPL